MSDIIVVGASVMDVMMLTKRTPSYGETELASDVKLDYGGKGANQAVMASLLGAKVSIVTRVGNDHFGNSYLQRFSNLGIDATMVTVTNGGTTDLAQILLNEQSSEQAITVHFGETNKLRPQDLLLAEAKISAAKCLLVTMEAPIDAVLLALRLAKRHLVVTVANPSPRLALPQLLSSAKFDEFLSLVDLLCTNEQELQLLSNEPLPWQRGTREFQDAVSRVMLKMQAEFRRVGNPQGLVVCTLGDQGAAFWNQSSQSVQFLHPALLVTAVDATGAGDCFLGSLAYFLARRPELSIEQKVKRALQIAAASVTKFGTQSSFPLKEELAIELFE